MTTNLSPQSYDQTPRKLRNLERRLHEIERRGDHSPERLAEIRKSYETMIRQYRREIKLYEARAAHRQGAETTARAD